MMRRLLNLSFAVLILNSCAFHSGMMTANLPDNFDQEIIAQAEGQATAVYVLGIGGLDHKHLVTDAKKMLYSNYPLKKGEAYANVVVDRRLFPFLLVNVNQIFVTADIVADPSLENDSLQRFFEPINEKGIRMLSKDGIWIKANDEVMVVNGQQNEVGRVVRILGRNKVLVTSPNFGEKKYRLRKFFLKNQNVRFKDINYYVGQSVPIEIDGVETFGTIIGINHVFLLFESGKKTFIRPIRGTTRFIEKEK
jgi:ribosomal protein L24